MKSAISIKDELFEYYMERESTEHFLVRPLYEELNKCETIYLCKGSKPDDFIIIKPLDFRVIEDSFMEAMLRGMGLVEGADKFWDKLQIIKFKIC